MMDMGFVEDNFDGYGLCFESISILTILSVLVVIAQKLRPLPMGMDPYYYLAHAGVPQPGMPPLFFHLAGLPPSAVAFLATLCTLILAYLIFNQLGARNPLIPSILITAAPGLTFRMAIFEDDLLGIPLGLGAILLWLKGRRWVALGLCFISFFFAWRGTALYGAMLVLSWIAERWKHWWVLLLGLMVHFKPNNLVGEENFGLAYMPVVLMGLLIGVKAWKKVPMFVQVWAGFFLFLGLLNAKWLVFAMFPLAFMLYKLYENYDKKKLYGFCILVCGAGLILGSLMVYQSAPTEHQFNDLMDMKQYIGEAEFGNSWHLGHWMKHLGMNPINDNLHPNEEMGMVPPPWNTDWAVHHNCSFPMEPYKMFKNYSWACLYRLPT